MSLAHFDLCGQEPTSSKLSFDNGRRNLHTLTNQKVADRDDHLKAANRIMDLALKQPDALFCGGDKGTSSCCCCTHIVERSPVDQWIKCASTLQKDIKEKLHTRSLRDRTLQDVLAAIEAAARQGPPPSKQWDKSFEWLKRALHNVCATLEGRPPPTPKTTDKAAKVDACPVPRAVLESVTCFQAVKRRKQGPNEAPFKLRPVQLCAILASSNSAHTRTPALCEMKTGEGKTNVCAVVAATIAKMNAGSNVLVVSSSIDRAKADLESCRDFFDEYIGKDNVKMVSDLAPTKPSTGAPAPPPSLSLSSVVAYGQMNDVLSHYVEGLQNGLLDQLHAWLRNTFVIIDEVDHVLIEQSENTLFIASPCASYQALNPITHHITTLLTHAEFKKDHPLSAVPEMAGKLLDALKKQISGKDYPTITDTQTCLQKWAVGAISAKLKREGKEYVLELAAGKYGGKALEIKIVDMSTGTESDGTRWTNEAMFVEFFQRLPVGGSSPLAFFAAFPHVLTNVAWFGGLTGTIGDPNCLDFYRKTYDIHTTYRFPRNFTNTIFELDAEIANSEGEWLANISRSARKWLDNGHGLYAKGPLLIVAESIQEAGKIKAFLEKDMRIKNRAHSIPYYLRDHDNNVHGALPDRTIIIASNKGGRGLDLLLDGKCQQEGCSICACQLGALVGSEMGSILFVIITKVLSYRQHEQACGRCGRSGKAGVVQLQILRDSADDDDDDVNTTILRLNTNLYNKEKVDLQEKVDRLKQQRFDAMTLEAFCQWKKRKIMRDIKKIFPEPCQGTPSTTNTAPPDVTSTEGIEALRLVVVRFFDSHYNEMWAFWYSAGGYRRCPHDDLQHFKKRMNLVELPDLSVGAKNSLAHNFCERFLKTAVILRMPPRSVYNFVRALSRANLSTVAPCDMKLICIDLLRLAIRPSYGPIPDGDNATSQPEETGNAALLLAFLSPRDRQGALSVFVQCIDRLIRNLPSGAPKGEQIDLLKKVFEYRKSTIVNLNGDFSLSTFESASPEEKRLAHLLGYEFCQVYLEFYPSGQLPPQTV